MVRDWWNSHQKVQWVNTRQYKPIFLWVFLIKLHLAVRSQENKNIPATKMCLCTHVVFNWMEEEAEFTPQRGADRPDVRGKGNLVETKKKDHTTESNGFSTLLFSQSTAFLQEQCAETPSQPASPWTVCAFRSCQRFGSLNTDWPLEDDSGALVPRNGKSGLGPLQYRAKM